MLKEKEQLEALHQHMLCRVQTMEATPSDAVQALCHGENEWIHQKVLCKLQVTEKNNEDLCVMQILQDFEMKNSELQMCFAVK